MGRRKRIAEGLDTELDDLPPAHAWRVWMGRVEAVIFASPKPVTRDALARVVGKRCNLDALIEDIRAELADRPYDLVAVAGGWRHRTRSSFANAIHMAAGVANDAPALSNLENLVVTAIGYFQPVTRRELGAMLGREISRDTLSDLRSFGLIATGPKSPRAGAPNTYVTTLEFLSRFGLNTLQELPDREAIENARFAAGSDAAESDLDEAFGIGDETAEDADAVEGVENL